MEEKCPCQTDVQSCCACVSMHCDECHKPQRSKFIQGRFCSNCGRPLKAELTRLYVPKSEVDWHRMAELNAQRIMELEAERDALIKNYAECMKDYAREIFEEIKKIFVYRLLHSHDPIDDISGDLDELKKKYTESCTDCQHFIGCEPSTLGVCDEYKEKQT